MTFDDRVSRALRLVIKHCSIQILKDFLPCYKVNLLQMVIHNLNNLFLVLISLQETLSIPTMVSMTQCPKQLIKRLRCLMKSPCVTWLTCESLFGHLND
jgi:hypothetical protein